MNDWCSAAFRSPQPLLISANSHYFLECRLEAHFLLSAAVPSSAQRKHFGFHYQDPKYRHHFISNWKSERFMVFQMTLWFGFQIVKAVVIPGCLFPVPCVTLFQPELLTESCLLARNLLQKMGLGIHLHHRHKTRLCLCNLGIWLLQGCDPQLGTDFLLQGTSFAAWNTFHNKQDAWGEWLSVSPILKWVRMLLSTKALADAYWLFKNYFWSSKVFPNTECCQLFLIK